MFSTPRGNGRGRQGERAGQVRGRRKRDSNNHVYSKLVSTHCSLVVNMVSACMSSSSELSSSSCNSGCGLNSWKYCINLY